MASDTVLLSRTRIRQWRCIGKREFSPLDGNVVAARSVFVVIVLYHCRVIEDAIRGSFIKSSKSNRKT